MAGSESLEQVEVVNCQKKFGSHKAIDGISFKVLKGEFLCILGPSGCGKTTMLRMIAGLEKPSAGEIRIGGKVVFSSTENLFLPPQDRNLGMVFQNYALWPHLTVFSNVAYPLKLRGFSRDRIAEMTAEALKVVELADVSRRYPHQISGGQQQRVALARTLAYRPTLVLLDEPLANLDRQLRDQMRVTLKHLLQRFGITTIFVTHDQTEAFTLADRILLMRAGKLVQEGTPQNIYRNPVNSFVVEFTANVNSFEGTVIGQNNESAILRLGMATDLETIRLRAATPGDSIKVMIRPEDIAVHSEKPLSTGNTFRGKIQEVFFLGEHTEYLIEIENEPDILVSAFATHSVPRAKSESVWLSINSNSVLAFPNAVRRKAP